MLINPGFFNWIAAKYSVNQQRHRRFPPLTLLVIKRQQILQPMSPRKITVLQTHTDYYLNQNLFFNINLFARAAGKTQIVLKDPLKIVSTIPGLPMPKTQQTSRHGEPVKTKKAVEFLVHHLETRLKQHPYPGYTNLLAVSFMERLQKQVQSSPLPLPPAAGKGLPPSTLRHWERTFSRYYPAEKTAGEPDPTPEKLKASLEVLNSTAVFKPLLTMTKLQPGTTKFKGFVYVEGPGKFAPGRQEKQGLTTPGHTTPGTAYRDSKQSTPALKYANPIQNTLESMKKTVAVVEKKVNEEITTIKKLYPDKITAAYHKQAVPPAMSADINQLTDRVYRLLERKIKTEKERRGW